MRPDFFIGIQYNWREGESFPLKARLQKAASSRIEIEDHHVLIRFPDDEAPQGQNRKLLDRILPKALPVSDYSNIYLRLPLPPGGVPKLKATGKLNVAVVTDSTNFLANFTDNADADLLAVIKEDVRYTYYNELFRMMAEVAKATGMLHTLEFMFEDKEEWDVEEDLVFVSCMLEDG
jgi:hypothetical protein